MADLVDGEPPIRDVYIWLGDAPGHGMTPNEDVARAHLQPGRRSLGMRRSDDRGVQMFGGSDVGLGVHPSSCC